MGLSTVYCGVGTPKGVKAHSTLSSHFLNYLERSYYYGRKQYRCYDQTQVERHGFGVTLIFIHPSLFIHFVLFSTSVHYSATGWANAIGPTDEVAMVGHHVLELQDVSLAHFRQMFERVHENETPTTLRSWHFSWSIKRRWTFPRSEFRRMACWARLSWNSFRNISSITL